MPFRLAHKSLIAALAFAACAVQVHAAPIALPDLRTQGVTLSGLSSGAFMAVQMGVAASSLIDGATLFAGGPWFCAEGDASKATGVCMRDPSRIEVPRLLTMVNEAAAKGLIDPLSGLRGKRYLVVNGTKDNVVQVAAAPKLVEFMNALGAVTVINVQIPMGHGLPVLGGKVPCGESRTPWLNDCGVDGPAMALQASLGFLRRPLREASAENLFVFDQREFGSEAAKMANEGHLYVPKRCQDSRAVCRLHVVFHGCVQDPGVIGLELVQNAGYNRLADANDVIVLYPAAKSSTMNPNGCWDWWGYTGKDYALKSAKQIKAVLAMIQRLRSSN